MKDVRFGDLAEPVGDAVRFAAACADEKKQKLVKQVALGQVRVFADARQLRRVPISCGRVRSVSNSKVGALRSPVSPTQTA